MYLFIAIIAEFDLLAGWKSDTTIRHEVKKPAEQNLREIMERILARGVTPKSDAGIPAPRNKSNDRKKQARFHALFRSDGEGGPDYQRLGLVAPAGFEPATQGL